jgi:deoxyadenosine/deoxycytidine kinase
MKQDEKMKKSAARARDREVARERKWKDYSSRADASYDRWIDSVMQ